MESTISILNLSKDDLLDLVSEAVQSAQKARPNLSEKELLSRKETYELLGVNPATLHRWTVRGKVKSYGIGGRVYYKRSEIVESLKSLK